MNDEVLRREVLEHWGIANVRASVALHYKGTVFLVTTTGGDRLVLKEVGDGTQAERLRAEYQLLLHLDQSSVPVAVPLLAQDGRPYVEHGDRIYSLSPYLLPADEEGADDLRVTYEHMGIAIAQLHEALATYPGEITSWTMALTLRVFDDAIPAIREHLRGEELQRFDSCLAGIDADMRSALADLPVRRIHGDCHTGNLLLHNNRVAGFIDLDHLPVGPAIYDICSALVDQVKWSIRDREHTSTWLGAFDRAITGYERVIPLLQREKAAIWYGMLAIQLLFAYWLFEHGNREWAELNMDAFYWLHEHGGEISRRVAGITV